MNSDDLKLVIAVLAFALSLEGFLFTLLVYRRGVETAFETLRATILEKNAEVTGNRDYLVNRSAFMLKRYERALLRAERLASEPAVATLEGDIALIQAMSESDDSNPALTPGQIQQVAEMKYSSKNHLFLIQALSSLQIHTARLGAKSWIAHLDGYDQVIDEYLTDAATREA